MAIIEYAINGKCPEDLNPVAKAIIEMAKPQIDTNNKRWSDGCKGGAPKGICNNPNGRRGKQEQTRNKPETNQKQTKNKPKTNQDETINKPNVNDNVNDNENDLFEEKTLSLKKESEKSQDFSLERESKKNKIFKEPSIEEIQAYIDKNNLHYVTAEVFSSFYASKGWKVGNQKMVSWKKALSGWNARHKKEMEVGRAGEMVQKENNKHELLIHVDNTKYKNMEPEW